MASHGTAMLVILALSALAGLFAPPVRRPVPFAGQLCAALLGSSAGVSLFAVALASADHWAAATLSAVGALVLLHLAFWLARSPDDGSEGDEGGGGGSEGGGGPRKSPPPGPPQLEPEPGGPSMDWDAFDRHRADWERQPIGV